MRTLDVPDTRADRLLPDLLREQVDILPDAAGQDPTTLALAAVPKLRLIVLTDGERAPWMLTAERFLAAGDALPVLDRQRGSAGDTAVILYTSGTTANPKGCELTHALDRAAPAGACPIASRAACPTLPDSTQLRP